MIYCPWNLESHKNSKFNLNEVCYKKLLCWDWFVNTGYGNLFLVFFLILQQIELFNMVFIGSSLIHNL